ncbi:hypothetical protein COJ38_21450 [Bacillus cereus]|uniref:hypothetical protein n=1 Tax=Bacillus cereus TaxID=1396 RepID=UPI000BF6BDA0|nr:hypothetical protein [Bacillus cereus]PET50496.1 hypothetical protein CN521_14330 [Bacillus cereus]PFL86603.1 hypothetical protein COJ38_21450 [Bacillus cereus]PFN76393.1 hypothetical protein COJ64_09770 [Bacillus cereus]
MDIVDKLSLIETQLDDAAKKHKEAEERALGVANYSDYMYHKGHKEAFKGSLMLIQDLQLQVLLNDKN